MIKKGTATIKDVAERARVSPSTVSRVISNSPRISNKTKEKIHAIMDEMGYYPNAIARSLAKNRTGTIGVILPTTSEDVFLNPFFPEALRGIMRKILYHGTNRDFKKFNRYTPDETNLLQIGRAHV